MKENERLETTIKYYLGGIVAQYPIIKSVINEKPSRILEIGGCGYSNTYLSKKGYNVVGIDISPECVRWCTYQNKVLNGKEGRFFIADGFQLPFKDGSFDICYSQGLIEHFEDKDIIAILNEGLRVAKTVIFSVPSFYHPQNNIKIETWGHPEFLRARDWLKKLRHFNLVEWKYYGDMWLWSKQYKILDNGNKNVETKKNNRVILSSKFLNIYEVIAPLLTRMKVGNTQILFQLKKASNRF